MQIPIGGYHHVAMQKPQSQTTGVFGEGHSSHQSAVLDKQAHDSRIKRGYENLFSEYLTMMEVPEEEHAAAIHKVFQAVEVVVDPEHPVVLHVYKCLTPCTVRDGDCSRNRERVKIKLVV
ncbi:hypothetical protein ACLB2K_060979 [Fragaria x ananassa]